MHTDDKTVPGATMENWRIQIQWASGRAQYVNGFETLHEAEMWIKTDAGSWLDALQSRLL